MKHVHSMCYDSISKECSQSGHKAIGADYDETMKCVQKSFDKLDMGKSNDNTVLKRGAEYFKMLGAGFWPSVAINNRTYRGDLNPDNVFGALCAGFADKPKQCGGKGQKLPTLIISSDNEGISGNMLIFVVILLVLVNLVLIILYKRCTNKDVNDDM